MTKNKKKLRRAERRYSVSRTAQSLVLTGLLLAGGVGSALATDVNWDTDTTIAAGQSAVLNGSGEGKFVADSLTITGGSLSLSNSSFVFGQASPYTGAPTASLTMSGGMVNITDSQIAMATATISGGSINIAGTIVEGAASPEGHWRNGSQLYIDGDTDITGGSVSISNNGQFVLGRSGVDGTLNTLAIDGGTVNMSNGLLRASSTKNADFDPDDEGTYSKITIGGTGASALNTAAGSHNVIASRNTVIDDQGSLNINGTTMLVGAMGEIVNPGITNIPNSAPDAWKYVDPTAAGKLTLSAGGTINIANTGVLIAGAIDFAQDGGSFTTSKLTVGPGAASFKEGDGAIFNSYALSGEGIANVAGKLTVGAAAAVELTGKGSLTVGSLDLSNTGQINITGNGGTSSRLNIESDTTLAAADFAGTATNGKIALMNNGRVWVHGKLTLKGADATEQSLATKGAVKVWSLDVVKADNSLGDVKVTGDGNFGQLSITAKDNTNVQKVVANAGQLWATDKGIIKFGEDNFASAGTINANLKAGGASAANAGTIQMSGGTWALASGKTLDVITNGTLTIGATDGTTFSPANFDASQGTLKVDAGATKAAVLQLSSLKLKLADITTDYAALGGTIGKKLENDGTLILSGFAGADTSKEMSIGEVTTLTGAIMTGSGTVKLDGVTVTTDANTALSDVAGAKLSIETAVVKADAMNGGAAVVGGLHGATATTEVSNSANLTLTGQGNTGGQLITGTTGNTGIKLDAATLTLGNATASTAGSGTLTGDVDMSAATAGNTVNIVNGSYTVTGDIKGSAEGDTINVIGAKLLVNEIALGGTAASTLTVTGGSLQAHKLSTSGDGDIVTINGGSLHVGEIAASGTDTINVGNSAAAGTLTTDKMTLNGATLFLDPSWIDGQEYQDAGTASRAAIAAFATNVDGIVMVGQNSQLSLGTNTVEQLTAAINQMGTVWGKNGITAALGIYSPQTLAATGAIEVDGTRSAAAAPINAKNATFADKSLLVVSAAGIGSGVALTGTNLTAGTDSKLTVNAGAKLHILGGKGGDTINIVAGFKDAGSTISAGGWEGTNLTTDTALLTAKAGTAFTTATGSYSVTLNQNAATSIFPKLSTSMGGLVDTVVGRHGVDTMSGNTGIRFISRAVSDSYIGTNNPTQAAATIEGAAQLAVVGAAPAMTISAANAATSAATTRTSFATPLLDSTKAVAMHQSADGSLSLDSGLSAGSSMKTGLGLWIMPLYQSNNVWGMKAENFKGGYTSDLGGVALGADYTIDDSLRFGVAFNLGGGYAQSKGDFNSTDNSFNFWGINLYGGWTQNNFGLSGDVGYTSTYNKLKQELPSAMQMGDIKSDVTSRAWTAGLRGEYKFATEALDIIPHVGVRYLGLTTDDYKAKIGGGTVFKADESFQSIWTFPVGLTFTKEMTNSSGWSFRPQLDLGVTPAAGDVKAKSRVRIPNVDSSAEMKMQVVDYLSYDGGVGLEMKKDNVSFGVNYNIQASEHRTGHGVFGTFRYEF